MSGGFSNPIIGGGGALVYPSIQSPNFNVANPPASPTPSWAILKTGLAYFFGLILSGGTISGPDYIINSAGVFIYSGTPAAGNLIGSWTFGTAGGVDGFGNAYPGGLTIGSNTTTQVNLTSALGAGFLQFLTNNAGFLGASLRAAGGSFEQLLITGPASTIAGHTDLVTQQFNSGTGSGNANMSLTYLDAAAVNHFYLVIGAAAVSMTANNVSGTHPGTGTVATPAVAESWQTPALLNNWQVGGPIPGGLRYAYNPVNGGRIDVEWDVFNNVVALPATSTIAQLSAPYLALVNGTQFRRNMASMNNYNFANNSPSAAWFWYDGAGNFQCINYETHAEFAGQGYIPLT